MRDTKFFLLVCIFVPRCLDFFFHSVSYTYLHIYIFLFFRQSPEQDFAGLPDPFGSYRAKLSYKDFGPPTTLDSQISDRSQSLDHIQDPKMLSYTQREINR